MPRPAMVVTGATGFVGRHLVDAIKDDFDIWALSRASPSRRGVTLPASARWLPVDIARQQDLLEVTEKIQREQDVEILVHLAGHYDFTGERHAEYERTNVEGMRNVLEAGRRLKVRDFIFSSSVAACAFPREGDALTEASPPDGDTPYAESKRKGEAMMTEYQDAFRCWTIRFAALFSDWCEYEPLFRFLEAWLSGWPRSRILAGCGLSAIPYLHARDAMSFMRCLIARREELHPRTILIASPDGATSHRELFEAATRAQFGERAKPILVPRLLCCAGLLLRELMGRTIGVDSFPRARMGRMIDLQLVVDSGLTRKQLGWLPRERLGILRRLPFLIQNRKAFVAEWHRRNQAALKAARSHENLRILRLLEQQMDEIAGALAEYVLSPARARRFPCLRELGIDRQRADNLLLLRALTEAVRTGQKSYFRRPCRELARRRRDEGYPPEELIRVLNVLNDLLVLSLADHDASPEWNLGLYDHITMTVQFGIDEVLDVFEEKPGVPVSLPRQA